jgi:hypothetical protein
MEIENLIYDLSYDPFSPSLNFEVAKKYEELQQTASAVSFYLRAAEYGYASDPLIAYSSLLRVSICFEDQNDRNNTITNCLFQAIQYLPDRPEGYFLLSRFHERATNWQESYTFAELGLMFSKQEESLPINVDYPGEYGLTFQKAVAAWWIGRLNESVMLLKTLKENPKVSEAYMYSINSNLEKINVAV